jgi:hypothetical protein
MYVNLADFPFEVTVGIGVAAAVIAFLGAALLNRRETLT